MADMKILKFLSCAFVMGMVLMVSGCGSGSGNGDCNSIKVIDLEKVFDKPRVELKLSDLASDIEYFALNTGEGFLPDYTLMDLIAVEDGFFLVPMPLGDTPFFKFSPDGVLQSQFSRIGRAEGEYVAPMGISYSEEKDAFIVVDFTGPVMVFSGAGEYLYSVPTEALGNYGRIKNAFFMGDDIVFFGPTADNRKFCAITTDLSGQILKEKVIYDNSNNEPTGGSIRKVNELKATGLLIQFLLLMVRSCRLSMRLIMENMWLMRVRRKLPLAAKIWSLRTFSYSRLLCLPDILIISNQMRG